MSDASIDQAIARCDALLRVHRARRTLHQLEHEYSERRESLAREIQHDELLAELAGFALEGRAPA